MVTTLNDCLLDLKARLKRAGVAGAQMEARELICAALELKREDLVLKKHSFLFDKDLDKLEVLVSQRLSGVPLQHLIGEWEFYGLTLKVSRDTLIPRPDTETLAECGIRHLKNRGGKCRMLDLCCGTGCVGMAVLKHVSEGITGVFADLSEPALEVTRRNLVTNHLTPRALTIQADALEEASPVLGKFHLITCNPPYIPTAEIMTLDAEVQQEPHMALDGGEDGLDFYRAVSRNFAPALAKGGALAFEVGLGQFEDVMNILQEAGYHHVQVKCDLAGIERVVWGIWGDHA